LATPRYRAEVLLAPVAEDDAASLSAVADQFRGLASLAGIAIGGGSNRSEIAVATLKSRSFAASFIQQQGILSALLEEDDASLMQFWSKRQPTLERAIRKLDRHVRFVTEDRRTGLVRLAIQWYDPQVASALANAMVEALNSQMRNEAVAESRRSVDYLREQLKATDSVEVRGAIYRLIENQMKIAMVASVRPDYAFKVIDAARPPDRPVSPRPALSVALGMLIGLVCGALAATWREKRSLSSNLSE
jgi:uncharacterized protein involved in exopolysaccharide biosynthesis